MTAPFRHLTRVPRPAPFPVGTRVRYIGPRETFEDSEGMRPLLRKGMEFDIVEVTPGFQGTGAIIDTDEDGDPIYDVTGDAASVYLNALGSRMAIVHFDNPDRLNSFWEVVS